MKPYDRHSQIFNQGADARLAGLPIRACPWTDPDDRRAWKEGWFDLEKYWGAEAKWYVRPLPEVNVFGRLAGPAAAG